MNVIATDAQLVARCRGGDEVAWRELVERFSRYVYAISVQGFRLSEPDAEDVFQEVFARAYQHLGKLRDDDAPINARGLVVWNHPFGPRQIQALPYGMGISFSDFPAAEWDRVRTYVDARVGEAPGGGA